MKQRIQKLLGLLLAIVLVLGLSAPVFALDMQTEAVFTVGTKSADAGATGVEIPITVVDSPVFTAIGLTFTFDTTALTLTNITRGEKIHPMVGELGVNLSTATLNFDWGGFDFEDGEIFILTFDVSQYAQSGNYEIGMSVSTAGWAASNPDNPEDPIRIITTASNFVSGGIQVSGLNVAKVNDVEYATLPEALAAAIDASPAPITMLKDALVADVDDRLVIPDGKKITLDMAGHTITSAVPGSQVDQNNKPVNDNVLSGLIEVQVGGELNIVDSSTNKGGAFVHTSGALYTRFLVNSGTVNMSDVSVSNFYDGIRDGSLFGKAAGTYGTITDCRFVATETGGISNFQKAALNFGQGQVDAVTGSVVEGYEADNALSVVVGTYNDEGSLGLLEDSELAGLMVVSRKGSVGTIKNCSIVNVPESKGLYQALEVEGQVDLIDGGYYEGSTTSIKLSIFGPGHIGEIKDGEFKAEGIANHETICIHNVGTIGKISGGDFYAGSTGNGQVLVNHQNGTIDVISGGTFKSDGYQVILNDGGHIKEIRSGTFITGPNHYGVVNRGTIDSISGGVFYSGRYSTLYNGEQGAYKPSVIGSISGGLFINAGSSSTITCNDSGGNGSVIESINGGTFISKASSGLYITGNDSVVEEISGGTFIGGNAGLYIKNNNIGEISGGYFVGLQKSVFLDGELGDHQAHIDELSGGYFKTLGEDGLIVVQGDSSVAYKEGHGMATVPLREEDLDPFLPDDLNSIFEDPIFTEEELGLMTDRTGYHHVGETVKVTWKIDDSDDDDLFVKLDPVYYPGEEPAKEDHLFRGWRSSDGTLYRPQEELPKATVDATYLADFLSFGSELDYEVSLRFPDGQSENVNQGETFEVDLVISSEDNGEFFGATIEVTYDNELVDEEEILGLPTTFGVLKTTSGGTTTLKFAGASQNAYSMTENAYKLATIKFKAAGGIASTKTTLAIGEDPVVNQEYAVDDANVDKDDLEVSLWNLQVTFQAGVNASLIEAVAYVKYDTAGLFDSPAYDVDFVEPVPAANDYHTLDFPLWKPVGGGAGETFSAIQAKKFTADATYQATASPDQYSFTDKAEALEEITGVEGGLVTHGIGVTFEVKTRPGYGVDKVKYRVGDGNWNELTPTQDIYTIPGSAIMGDVEVVVDYLVVGNISFLSKDDYAALPEDYQLLLFTLGEDLEEGTFEYSGTPMFYSSKYSDEDENQYVYVFMVGKELDEDGVRALIQINLAGERVNLSYDCDVNLNTKVNSTDAVLVYGLFKGLHVVDPDFSKVTMRMRLEADVDGDKEITVSDAHAVLNFIWYGTTTPPIIP